MNVVHPNFVVLVVVAKYTVFAGPHERQYCYSAIYPEPICCMCRHLPSPAPTDLAREHHIRTGRRLGFIIFLLVFAFLAGEKLTDRMYITSSPDKTKL